MRNSKNEIGFWEALKNSLGIKPETVHAQYTLRTEYYWWQLLNLVKGCFNVSCPDNWDYDYMLDCLLIDGYFGVTDTSIGVVPLKCGLHGINVFSRPNKAIFSNPILGSFERQIDENCVIVSLHGTGFRRGITLIINVYAEKLAQCDAAIDVGLMNSKVAHVFGARTKRESESLKAMMDEINDGKPSVFVKDEIQTLADTGFYKTDVKQNFVVDLIQIEKRKIIEEFLTLFGINNANTDKRERLNSEEVNSNNIELLANTEYWNKNIKNSCDKANKMFPDINLQIEMPFRNAEEKRFKVLINTLNSPESELGDSSKEEENV
jgi:hypothetical protein